jgi:hypothetical protein
MVMAEKNAPVSQSEFSGMVQALQTQMDRLEAMIVKQSEAGGGSKSPMHHSDYHPPPFGSEEKKFPRHQWWGRSFETQICLFGFLAF